MGIEMRLSVVNYALEKIEAICCKKRNHKIQAGKAGADSIYNTYKYVQKGYDADSSDATEDL